MTTDIKGRAMTEFETMTRYTGGRMIFTYDAPTGVRLNIVHADSDFHPFQLWKSYSDGSIRHMGISNDAVRAMYAALKEKKPNKINEEN